MPNIVKSPVKVDVGEPDWGPDPIQDEPVRLAALHGYQVLDTDVEEAFDDLTCWARDHFAVPIALVSLVDAQRQWFKSACGLGVRETPRDIAFCNYTILHSRPMVVEDTTEDDRFRNNPLVMSEPHIRFYAGAPIITPAGFALGTVCIVDREPRRFSTAQRVVLSNLAKIAMAELECRGSPTAPSK